MTLSYSERTFTQSDVDLSLKLSPMGDVRWQCLRFANKFRVVAFNFSEVRRRRCDDRGTSNDHFRAGAHRPL